MSNTTEIKIRWATWWPIPYWNERFNSLARTEEIDLEVVFLTAASQLLPLSKARDNWNFKYSIVRNITSHVGYAKFLFRVPKPWGLLKGDYDLLVMPYGDPDYVAAAILSKILGRPYCLYMTNNLFDHRPSSLFRERVKRFICKNAIGALSTGPSQTEYARHYFRKEDIRQVGNPAPGLKNLNIMLRNPGRSSIRNLLGWDRSLVILFVGRLAKEKGLDTLLDALRYMKARGIRVRTVLVGEGPMEEYLRKVTETECLDVDFAGFLEGTELTKRYIAADIFVLPSHSEPWGLVVNEAMEAGLPIVVSDRVGAKDALVHHGENGFIFDSGGSSKLASAIIELVDNGNLRNRMAKNSLKIIRNCSIDAWVEAVSSSLGHFLKIWQARRGYR